MKVRGLCTLLTEVVVKEIEVILRRLLLHSVAPSTFLYIYLALPPFRYYFPLLHSARVKLTLPGGCLCSKMSQCVVSRAYVLFTYAQANRGIILGVGGRRQVGFAVVHGDQG